MTCRPSSANRSEFYRALPSGPFYGFNRPGVQPVEAIIDNWWRQGMMGGAKAHYDGIVCLLPDGFHRGPQEGHRAGSGDARRDDQIVPYADSGRCPRSSCRTRR